MSEAEKKWDKWDFKFSTPVASHAAQKSREAYKAALRREIEKRFDRDSNEARKELKYWIELLDTVEP